MWHIRTFPWMQQKEQNSLNRHRSLWVGHQRTVNSLFITRHHKQPFIDNYSKLSNMHVFLKHGQLNFNKRGKGTRYYYEETTVTICGYHKRKYIRKLCALEDQRDFGWIICKVEKRCDAVMRHVFRQLNRANPILSICSVWAHVCRPLFAKIKFIQNTT